MIRHVINVTKRQTSRNILNLFAASQYGGHTVHPRSPPTTVIQRDLDLDLLNTAASKLTITKKNDNVYKLPEYEKKTAILDPKLFSSLELPSGMLIPKIQPRIPQHQDIINPVVNEEKSCKSDLKQRRRHMNRHKLKKLRKRMKFVYMKLEQKKARRKALQLQQECDEILNAAKKWDALTQVKHDLELARKGGFGVDVFERKSL